MKVEIADDFSALMDMNVSNTLALGTLMDWLCETGIIDRSDFVAELGRRRMSFQHAAEDAHAFAFEALEEALQSKPPGLRLVTRDGQRVGLEA